MLINSNNSIQPPYGTVESARRKCSLRYSYVALVSDQEFCSFEEEPEMALVIGQEFCSFEELSESVKKWEKTNFVTLYTRSSRSIEAARRRAPNRTFLDKLKFSELDYACVHGGREYKSKATQRRPCQK